MKAAETAGISRAPEKPVSSQCLTSARGFTTVIDSRQPPKLSRDEVSSLVSDNQPFPSSRTCTHTLTHTHMGTRTHESVTRVPADGCSLTSGSGLPRG